MSDDFIRALQGDLVEAMERYERRGFTTGRRPRSPRPASFARLAALAAVLVAVVLAVRTLAPEPQPVRPRVVATLAIGGSPVDAVLADGSLWASDFTGSVVQVDPGARRLTARVPVTGAPQPITTDAGSVWVQTAGAHCEGFLLRIDAVSRRIADRTALPYPSEQDGALAPAAGGGVWVKRGCASREGLDRLDGDGAVKTGVALPRVDGLAAAAGNLWAIGHDGTLTQIDRGTGRVRRRWPGLAPLADPNTSATKALVADGTGVWVLSTGRAVILRVEDGRVARRIAVDESARPLMAVAPDGLWIASADRLGRANRLTRIDPETGRPTATLALGGQRPVAIVPAGDELCVLTADGEVLFVRS